jgi:hypothetical protein
MDPHVQNEQPGFAATGSQAEGGAAYLQQLKSQGEREGAPPGSANADMAPAPVANPVPATEERRRSPRFLCSGSVELQAEDSQVRMWGSLKDISLHGCYVEMSATFPLGTKINLTVESAGVRVRTPGTVRVSYPFLGMGVCFRDTEPGQQMQLEQLIRALSGQRAVLNDPPADQPGLPDIVASADPQAFLEEITGFFKKHGFLSRDQFYQIAERVRRS